MNKIIYKKTILALFIFVVTIIAFGQSAYAQSRTRTYNVRYQEEDRGRSRLSSSARTEIRRLERQDEVRNLRIPILFGVAVRNLYDSWGDARSGGREHEGIDIIAPRGELIVTPTDAIVTTVDIGGNGGKHVFTTNPGGERFYYAHLDDFAESLDEGDILKAGDLIGYVGNTGNASGGVTHLHFGIYDDDHDASNPFLRLTTEFSVNDKVDAFLKILDDSDDPDTLAQKIVSQYKDIFIEAYARGTKLPSSIIEILTGKRAEVTGISRVLQQGMNGDDVKALQVALGITADGDFGPKTKAAVTAFQIKSGLSGSGVFDSTTRMILANSSLVATALPAGCTTNTLFSPTSGAKCIPTIIIPLPAGCTQVTTYSPTTGVRCRPI